MASKIPKKAKISPSKRKMEHPQAIRNHSLLQASAASAPNGRAAAACSLESPMAMSAM